MPYFIYKIWETPVRRLEKLEELDIFGNASKRAKHLRSEIAPNEAFTIKVIFAENEIHAEELLNEARPPLHNPDDD